jgi:hypothetical protein
MASSGLSAWVKTRWTAARPGRGIGQGTSGCAGLGLPVRPSYKPRLLGKWSDRARRPPRPLQEIAAPRSPVT